MQLKLDMLAFAAHPDDTEISCSGTLALHKALGQKTGVVDITRGDLGTKGSVEIRQAESEASAKILELDVRENLGLRDGFFQNDEASQLKVIQAIRKYRPEIILAPAISDRHSDHGKAARLVADASYLSGLRKIITHDVDGEQEAWRPKVVLHYIQDYVMVPDIVVDITSVWEKKIASVKAFESQFFNKNSSEPVTPISVDHFMEFIAGRAMDMGRFIGVKYGEGFVKSKPVGVKDLTQLY